MANRPGLAIESCMAFYESAYEQAGQMSFFWEDLLQSLHMVGDHETELEQARISRRYNPDDRRALTREIMALVALGQVEQVSPLLDESRQRHGEGNWDYGTVLNVTAEYLLSHGYPEEAAAVVDRAVGWQGNQGQPDLQTARTFFLAGNLDGAQDVLESMLAAANPESVGEMQDVLGWLGATLAAKRERERALEASDQLRELEDRPYVYGGPALRRVWIAAQLGDLQEATQLAIEAYDQGAAFSPLWRHSILLRPLQGHPAFERFMEPKG